MMMKNWNGKQVVIIGAARQGLALARYLLENGAKVTLNDRRTEFSLSAEVSELSHPNLKWVLGEHPFDILDGADLVCPSGGVPLNLPLLVEARKRRIKFSNDSQVFLEEVPCPVIGITGSAGKTTTTGLVGLMAQKWVNPPAKAWIGGNIGLPLIDKLPEISREDLVVLELSSFQLELMQTSPQIAAVLNITPNHLDRHGTMQAYSNAKSNILRYQHLKDTAVLNRDDPGSWNLISTVRGNLVTFGLDPASQSEAGSFFENDTVFLNNGNQIQEVITIQEIHLRGKHNVLNVVAACSIAMAAGISLNAMQEAIREYKGAPHRLELVREVDGVRWYNDSIATAPERTMAAIHSFAEPIVLLLGGKDKDLPWDDLINLVNNRVDHLVVFGQLADKIMAFYSSHNACRVPQTIDRCEKLEQAVSVAAARSQPGDVVLLAPAGTSFDEFKDFEERGEKFRVWVCNLT